MYRYVVALLLINTFYCSFGYPLEVNETLGKSLQLLADNCQNKFLSTQIKNHIGSCDITLSADRDIKETELECLIFYDINTQLCTTFRDSKLDLHETYESEINQVQNVDKTCTDASKNWKFTNLTVHPKYYNTSQKVLKSLVKCLQACGAENLMSEDTNFFCKYYQWGSKLLQQSSTVDAVSDHSGAVPPVAKTTSTTSSLAASQDSSKIQSIKEKPQPDNVLEQAPAQLEVPNYSVQTDLDNTGHVKLPENAAVLNNNHPTASKSGDNKDSEPSVHVTPVSSAKNNSEKAIVSNDLPLENKSVKDLIPKTVKEDPSDDTIDDNGDSVMYDSGDPLDNAQLSRGNGNDDNDPNLDTETKLKDPKKDLQKNVNTIVSSLDVAGVQKDIYTNTMSDQFGEVDDHFFSFFLTATILVVFFYVLYHNKSKFRKVFLGLLVEGRQSGRRRNSRGHEYRRLDTLEQAMSANSTAPPSKIIY